MELDLTKGITTMNTIGNQTVKLHLISDGSDILMKSFEYTGLYVTNIMWKIVVYTIK